MEDIVQQCLKKIKRDISKIKKLNGAQIDDAGDVKNVVITRIQTWPTFFRVGS